MDYPVADFGQDTDIKNSLENEAVASKQVGHIWKFKTDESFEKYRNKAKDTDYNFYPDLDEDMKSSLANQRFAEGKLGIWDFE